MEGELDSYRQKLAGVLTSFEVMTISNQVRAAVLLEDLLKNIKCIVDTKLHGTEGDKDKTKVQIHRVRVVSEDEVMPDASDGEGGASDADATTQDSSQELEELPPVVVKPIRGRRKGSKNRTHTTRSSQVAPIKRGKGRPKGSKTSDHETKKDNKKVKTEKTKKDNKKVKTEEITKDNKKVKTEETPVKEETKSTQLDLENNHHENDVPADLDVTPKRRRGGRPKGSKTRPKEERIKVISGRKVGRPSTLSDECWIEAMKYIEIMDIKKPMATEKDADASDAVIKEIVVEPHTSPVQETAEDLVLNADQMKPGYKIYKCTLCTYQRASPSRVLARNHVLQHHLRHLRPHLCDTCGMSFLKAGHLENHKYVHSRERGEKKYLCHQCSFVTHSNQSLSAHLRLQHNPTIEHQCELCDFTTKYKGSLRNHMNAHYDLRPFKCGTCGKSFFSTSQLGSHSRIHKERQFACKTCGKTFVHRVRLRYHETIHTGKKDFACQLCTYVCNVKTNLMKHIKTVHKLQLKSGMKVVARVAQPEHVTNVPKDENNSNVTVVLQAQSNTSQETIQVHQEIPEISQDVTISTEEHPSKELRQAVETITQPAETPVYALEMFQWN